MAAEAHGATRSPPRWASIGLAIFGCVAIGYGVLLSGMVLLVLYKGATFLGGLDVNLTLGLIGALGIVLGIGSIRARRWARALCEALSLNGLVLALSIAASGVPGCIVSGMTVGSLSLVGYLFYGGAGVRLTCEARDRAQAWTDRCPVPVLAWSVSSFLGASLCLISWTTPAPFFGTILVGLPGAMVKVAYAALLCWSAVTCFRLEARGWWLSILLCTLFWTSAALTDPVEWMRASGLAEAGSETPSPGLAATLLPYVVEVVWLLYLRRFFFRRVSPGASESAAQEAWGRR